MVALGGDGPMLSGGELVVRTLARAGVNTAFGINGAHTDAIFQAANAPGSGVRIIDVRHEANAGHAAEGYALTHGPVGAAIITAGGAFTNVLTSVANAWRDRTPVVYIAGSGPLDQDQTNDLQADLDQVALAAPITKWSHRVTRTEQVPRLLAQAIRIATTPPMGPVVVDIPWDVLRERVEASGVEDFRLMADTTGAAPHAAIERIRELLGKAKRPVAVVGAGFERAEARENLRRFSEASGVPLLADHHGLGAVVTATSVPHADANAVPGAQVETGSASDRGLRMGGGMGSRVGPLGGLMQVLATVEPKPDLVLMLGVRWGLLTAGGSGQLIPKAATVVQVDADGSELGRLQNVDLAIAVDPVATVAELARVAEGVDIPERRVDWRETLREAAEARRSCVAVDAANNISERIHPYQAVAVIAECVSRGAIVVGDGALSTHWFAETVELIRPRHYLSHGHLGSMGVGMGLALGAQAAHPGEPVVLVTGDGAVGFGLAEFDSLVRADLPVVVIVLNNRAWGATLHAQQSFQGPEGVTNNRLDNGSYAGVARALGANGYEVTVLRDLAPAIRAALDSGLPSCIDVQVDLAPIPPDERMLLGQPLFGR